VQTDPIGPADNANLYAYVHNDSVNLIDPLGLEPPIVVTGTEPPIVVTGRRPRSFCESAPFSQFCRDEFSGLSDGGGGATHFPGGGIGVVTGPLAPPIQQQQKQCSQGVLNFANDVSNLGNQISADGNDVLGMAGVAALAGVPISATGVGAPAGAADEVTAGGIAGVGLATKLIGATSTYFGHFIARVETGTTSSFGKDIFASVAAVFPSGGGRIADVAQDQAADAANRSLGNNSPPTTCPK
jgi:uncharacterized protein RhaS with RHS repeats